MTFLPFTTVPIFVAKSSIVTFDRLVGCRLWLSSTGSIVIVKCLRDMVLCEMASCPAVYHSQCIVHPKQLPGICLRSATVRPNRYVLPGRSHNRRPGEQSQQTVAWLRGGFRRGRFWATFKGLLILEEPHRQGSPVAGAKPMGHYDVGLWCRELFAGARGRVEHSNASSRASNRQMHADTIST